MLISSWAVAAASLLAGGFGFFAGLLLNYVVRQCRSSSYEGSRSLCTNQAAQYLSGVALSLVCTILVAVSLAASSDSSTRHDSSRSSYRMRVSLEELVAAVVVCGVLPAIFVSSIWYWTYEKRRFASLDMAAIVRIPLFGLIAGIMCASIVGLAVGLDGEAQGSGASGPSGATSLWAGFGFGFGVCAFLAFIVLVCIYFQETSSLQHLRGAMPNEVLTQIVAQTHSDERMARDMLLARLTDRLTSACLILAVQALREGLHDEAHFASLSVEGARQLIGAALVHMIGTNMGAMPWLTEEQASAAEHVAQLLRASGESVESATRAVLRGAASGESELNATGSSTAVAGELGAAVREFVTSSILLPMPSSTIVRALSAAFGAKLGADTDIFTTHGSEYGGVSGTPPSDSAPSSSISGGASSYST